MKALSRFLQEFCKLALNAQKKINLCRGELASPFNLFVNVQRSNSAKILSKKLRHRFEKSVFAPTIFLWKIWSEKIILCGLTQFAEFSL